jgi:uncharacterized OB-fold protein
LKQAVNAARLALSLTLNSSCQYICLNREYSFDLSAGNEQIPRLFQNGRSRNLSANTEEGSARHLPALERDTAFFWKAGAAGLLLICRCGGCGRYQHPPLPRCPSCAGDTIAPAPVSGRGRVATFTVNRQRWTAELNVPFVFAAVELEEQSELYVFTNIVGCAVDEVRIGMPVSVCFERHGEVFLPMFQPAGISRDV